MSIKVIIPETEDHKFNELNEVKNSIFLAGPCPRNKEQKDWRDDAIKYLESLGWDGIIINPTNRFYDDTDQDHLRKQTLWEMEACYKASAIVFWIERTPENPAYTTNIEFGNWFEKDGVFVGWTEKAMKNAYLDERLKIIGKERYHSLESLLDAVVSDLTREPKTWFIADTHFSQERTLELSKRPFRNTQEMDWVMISRWNKHIRPNDTVYHLGDFGDNFGYLDFLNFGTMHLVVGNYEKPLCYPPVDFDFPNVKIYEKRGDCKVTLADGREVICIHEPLDPDGRTDFSNDLCLYGHIHGRTLYKLNGTDCAVDSHNFAPISEEEIIWRLNAIQYLDDNVWVNTCK